MCPVRKHDTKRIICIQQPSSSSSSSGRSSVAAAAATAGACHVYTCPTSDLILSCSRKEKNLQKKRDRPPHPHLFACIARRTLAASTVRDPASSVLALRIITRNPHSLPTQLFSRRVLEKTPFAICPNTLPSWPLLHSLFPFSGPPHLIPRSLYNKQYSSFGQLEDTTLPDRESHAPVALLSYTCPS